MYLNEISPALGSSKNRTRVGRGTGSGHGKTCGKGHKGQKARSGMNVKPGFEGGQMPLYRRTPKRGFTSAVNTHTEELKLSLLASLEDKAVISLDLLKEHKLIARRTQKVRVIFDKEIKKVKIDSTIYITKGCKSFVEIVDKDA